MELWNIFRSMARSLLPLWSWGLECEICQMTFISPEAHHKYARRQRLIKKHEGKIPKIMR